MLPLERSPRGVNDEGSKPEEHEQRLRPPCIRAHGLAERALPHGHICVSHIAAVSQGWGRAISIGAAAPIQAHYRTKTSWRAGLGAQMRTIPAQNSATPG